MTADLCLLVIPARATVASRAASAFHLVALLVSFRHLEHLRVAATTALPLLFTDTHAGWRLVMSSGKGRVGG